MTNRWTAADVRLKERGPALLVIVLLAATTAAFVRAEQQKLVGSPLRVVRVDKLISPVCRCETARATIALSLRTRSRVTLAVVDEDGELVRTLIDNKPLVGARRRVEWDGRDKLGRVVPDGVYRPRLRVASERRTFLLVNRIRVDTTPPVATLVRVHPRKVSVGDRVTVLYRLSERAQPLLYVDGRIAVRGQRRRDGKLDWYGSVRGRRVRAGVHRLQLRARDDAGNSSAAGRSITVRVR